MKTRLLMLAVLFALLSFAAYADNLRTVVIDGQSMVSLRTFGDTFDAAIDYDGIRNGFSITLDYRTVDLIPYSRIAWVNDRQVKLPAAVVIIDDETYIPLGFICDAFGLDYRCTSNYAPVTIFNPRTLFRVVLTVDLDWGKVAHRWRRDYDCRDYRDYRKPAAPKIVRPQGWQDPRPDNHRPAVATQPQPWGDHENHGQVVKPTITPGSGRPEHGQIQVHEIRPGEVDHPKTTVPSSGRDPKADNARQGRPDQDGRNSRPGGEARNGDAGRKTTTSNTDGAHQEKPQDGNRNSNGKDQGREDRGH